MTELNSITDEQLRTMVQRDKEELEKALENGLCKSVLLLAGSIIEAILVDFFLAFPVSGISATQVLKANLANLLDWAEQEKLITSRTKEISTVIKNYRNLIHPGREYRLEERVDIHAATVAASLVEIIIQEITNAYIEKRGYTAEQAIDKIHLDPSCTPLFPHIIDTMVAVERSKLFKMIPEECRGEDDSIVVESLIKLHNLLKSKIPPEILKAEVMVFYESIRNRSKAEVMFLFRFFAENIGLLDNEKAESVIAYLLGALKDSNKGELMFYEKWGIYKQLGVLLNSQEGIDKLFTTIKEQLAAHPYEPFEEEETFLSIISTQIIPLNIDSSLKKRLENMIKELKYSRASKWSERIGIPF